MANVAGLSHGPDGTPSQEMLDSMIAAFEYVPPCELIEKKVEELKKYVKDMLTAQDKKDSGAFEEAMEKFNKKKDEVLKSLEEAKAEVEKKVHEQIDPIPQSIEDQIPAPIKAIADVDLLAPSITPKVSLDISTLENMVLAIVYPYQPIIKVVQWWVTHFIPKMTAYIAKRVGDIADMIATVSSLKPPEFPSELPKT